MTSQALTSSPWRTTAISMHTMMTSSITTKVLIRRKLLSLFTSSLRKGPFLCSLSTQSR